ncbi:MAG: hypothetical protein K2L07_05125 [Lachnospiraceae bacterium]|nr:hypothetical protein [Lachnospiraceae bacterium]
MTVNYLMALKSLECEENSLTNLDVSANTELYDLSCRYNQLTSLDLSNNIYLGEYRCDEDVSVILPEG